jgi:alkylation response protein AidB-like acyl-CoA dehydrogenase
VRTPREFASAFRAYADGGWAMIAAHPQYGGGASAARGSCAGRGNGLLREPRVRVVHDADSRRLCSARRTRIAVARQLYLPQLVAGRWMATMCLTEAQSGSDLGLVRTRALPRTTEATA